MAFQAQNESFTFRAATDLSNSQFHLVELTDNALEVDLSAANRGYGILETHPRSGENGAVITWGVTKAVAGLAVGVNDYITSAATGFAVPVNSGAAHPGNLKVLGVALTAAASGQVFTIDVKPRVFNLNSGDATP